MLDRYLYSYTVTTQWVYSLLMFMGKLKCIGNLEHLPDKRRVYFVIRGLGSREAESQWAVFVFMLSIDFSKSEKISELSSLSSVTDSPLQDND